MYDVEKVEWLDEDGYLNVQYYDKKFKTLHHPFLPAWSLFSPEGELNLECHFFMGEVANTQGPAIIFYNDITTYEFHLNTVCDVVFHNERVVKIRYYNKGILFPVWLEHVKDILTPERITELTLLHA